MLNENLGYQGGKILEDDLLGEQKKASKDSYEKYISALDQRASFNDIARVIEISQHTEAENPRKYFPKEIRKSVAKKLNLNIETDPYLVTFYNALHTLLDYKKGTDAFVCIKEGGTHFNARISIDITANPSKDSYKANVIAYFPEGSLDETIPEERQKLDEIIDKVSDEICQKATELKSRYFSNEKIRKTA